jgi:hypothetical protein
MNSLIQQVSETIGVLPDSRDKEAQVLAWLNRAAVMIYDQYDLPGSVFEQFFCVDNNKHVITFPWYVGAIRGVRWHDSSRLVTTRDMRPRYHAVPWTQPYLQWRQIATTPLHTPLVNSGLLTFQLTLPETEPFDIIVNGQTPQAANVTEIISFAPGDLIKTSVNMFEPESPFGVKSLKKTIFTKSDVVVRQGTTQEEIGRIPNNQLYASNIRVQILDWNASTPFILGEDCVEVLYKQRFSPFVNIDSIWTDERLVQGLVYGVKYIFAVEKEKMDVASVSKDMMEQICRGVCENMESGQELMIQTERHASQDAAIMFPVWPLVQGGVRNLW